MSQMSPMSQVSQTSNARNMTTVSSQLDVCRQRSVGADLSCPPPIYWPQSQPITHQQFIPSPHQRHLSYMSQLSQTMSQMSHRSCHRRYNQFHPNTLSNSIREVLDSLDRGSFR